MSSDQTKRYIIRGYNEIIDLSKAKKEYSEYCSFSTSYQKLTNLLRSF